jgi:hypothetical protein
MHERRSEIMAGRDVYWRIRPGEGHAWATVTSVTEAAESMLEGLACDPDQIWEVQPVWMTDDEFAALPEFMGW